MTPTLVKKLAEVMALAERVPKRGRNAFHGYDYATEADIASAIREALAARSVMLIPEIVSETRTAVGEKGSVLTTLEMVMELFDGESGESMRKPWRGWGSDKEDKGGYKALTGAEKYFLLKTFLMPTGDDPEGDATPEPALRAQPAPRPVAPAAAPTRTSAPAPEGACFVSDVLAEGVTIKGAPATRYTVTFSDGEKASTLRHAIGQAAQDAHLTGRPVERDIVINGRFHNLEALVVLAAETAPVDHDIPF